VRYEPPVPTTEGDSGAARNKGCLELEISSVQRWHLPALLVPVRWVLGDALEVRVVSTLALDPASGLVVRQRDVLQGWLAAPWPIGVLLGLEVPLLSALIRP
jgi:hypothetical protein